jgi:nitroreductase
MSNEAIQVLKTRRSVRKFKTEQVPREKLAELLEVASWAPTGKGLQNPLIVAVQEKATLDKLRRMNAEVLGADIDPYHGAPSIVLVFSPTDGSTYVEDASSVLTYICAAAHALGIASCWINRERQMFESEEGKKLQAEWGVPEKYAGIGAIAIGFQDGDDPKAKARKEDYVRWVE